MRNAQSNTDFEVASLDETGVKETHVSTLNVVDFIRYVLAGILFGILLVKSEVVSWFRIQEMFRFQSFHMYGVIGSAVMTGAISVFMIKRFGLKTIDKHSITIPSKKFQKGQILGGLLFGFGWALTGACPGPIYAIIGTGTTVFIAVLLSAIAGTYAYGVFRDRLPH